VSSLDFCLLPLGFFSFCFSLLVNCPIRNAAFGPPRCVRSPRFPILFESPFSLPRLLFFINPIYTAPKELFLVFSLSCKKPLSLPPILIPPALMILSAFQVWRTVPSDIRFVKLNPDERLNPSPCKFTSPLVPATAILFPFPRYFFAPSNRPE